MKLLILSLTLLALVLSCKSEKEMKEINENDSDIVSQEILEFAEKYNAIVGWDSLDIFSSVQYEDLLVGRPILLNQSLLWFNDIYRDGEVYHISISLLYPDIYFDLECSEKQKDQLLEMTDDGYFIDLIAIVSIEEVRKAKQMIEAEVESDFIDLNLVIGRSFIFKGKIIKLLTEQ